jgi:hypothetical protein
MRRGGRCFPARPAVGSTILLNGVQFEVIGTLQRIGHGDNSTAKPAVLCAVQHDAGVFSADERGRGAGCDLALSNYQPKTRALHEAALRKWTR